MEHHLLDELWIRSRAGNQFIAVIGGLIAIAAAALLTYAVLTTWGYAGLIDKLIWIVLLGEIVVGAAFATIAWRKLH